MDNCTDQQQEEEEPEAPLVNGTIHEEDGEENDPQPIVNHESAGSTPILICSPQGTPVNTPAEHLSGGPSPREGEQIRAEVTAGLVQNAMLQASKLASMCPQDDGEAGIAMPLLEPVNGKTKTINFPHSIP